MQVTQREVEMVHQTHKAKRDLKDHLVALFANTHTKISLTNAISDMFFCNLFLKISDNGGITHPQAIYSGSSLFLAPESFY